MRKVFSFVKGKKDDKKDQKLNPQISVEITNPSGQRITSDDEHIVGLQHGHSYEIDFTGKDKGMSKLHKAAWIGNLEKVKVNAKKVDVNLTDSSSRTPLHLAAAQGHTEVVWFLVNNNASLEVVDNCGFTPFLKAVECGSKDCVNLLIECGVNINASDTNGNNALHLASSRGFCNIASVLLKEGVTHSTPNNGGEFAMHIATSADHRDLVELMIRAGAGVDPWDKERRTPLMLAARSGHTSLARLLIQHGASLTSVDSNGWSAEDYAQFGGHQELVEMLKPPPTKIEVTEEPQASQETSETTNPEDESVCTMPPTLEPPKSWDLIKSGAINQKSADSPGHPDDNFISTKEPNCNENLDNSIDNNNEVPKESMNNYMVNVEGNGSTDSENKTHSFEIKDSAQESNKSVDSNENASNAFSSVNGHASCSCNASPMDCSQSFDNLDGKSCSTDFNSDPPGSYDNLDDMPERSLSIEIIQSTGKLDDTLEVCTVKGIFKESHSLDLLDVGGDENMSKSAFKRHCRNRSITLATQPQFWKSVDVIYGSTSNCVNKPSDIDSQLQCYDEALRQLAKVNIPKHSPDGNKMTPELVKQSNQDSLEDPKEKTVQMKDVAVSGPSSLETDKDDSFPPPPVYFMESDDGDITEAPSSDLANIPFPISMLTPIKETYLEQDSLSAVDQGDSDSVDDGLLKPLDDVQYHSDPGASWGGTNQEKVQLSLDYPKIVPCHLEGGDLFLTDRDLSQYYPNVVDMKSLHLKPDEIIGISIEGSSPQRSPSRLQRSEKIKSTDSDGPKFDIGGVCSSRDAEVRKKSKAVGRSSEDDDEESDDSKEEPPFWMTDKGACFSRQNTVISLEDSTPTSAHIKFDYGAGPSNKLDPDGVFVRLREAESPRSEAETASASDTPKHPLFITKLMEGGCIPVEERLEEILGDRLHDPTKQAGTIAVLRSELAKIETKYTQAQEELVTYRQRAISAERDLLHLRTLHSKLSEEKGKLYQELTKHLKGINREKSDFSDEDLKNQLKLLEEENLYEREKNKKLENYLEEVLSANRCMMSEREALIAQNITDVKKLQEDTLCWKERYEECAAKLELMERNQDPRLIEAQDTIETLKRTISILQQEKTTPSLNKLSDACTSMSGVENVSNDHDDKLKPVPRSDSEIQIADLERRLKTEATKRMALETQVTKLLSEPKDRYKWEDELGRVHERLEKEFVSKTELERLKFRQEEAIGRVKQEAVRESEVNVSAKIAEINRALQTQMNEQARIDMERTKSEATLKKEVEATRLNLLVELGKLQAELKAKEFEEEIIRQKCEKLHREIERMQDLRQKNLIEKSLSINLSDLSPSRLTLEADNSYIQSSYESRGKTLPSKEHRSKREK